MQINLPQGLGNAFTERLDSSPFLEFNMKQKAIKQAREEALNQYFDELPNTINTAGVAQKHLTGEHGGILDDIDLWKTNMMANKDAIRKGGWAREQAMADYQKILRKIDQAKARTRLELELGKAKFEGKLDPTDEDLEIIKKIGGSIYDPSTYKQDGVSEYGYEDLSPNLPSFDAAKQKALWDAATKGVTAGKQYDYNKVQRNPITGQAIVPFKKMFTPDQVKRIGDEAADIVSMDKIAARHYNRIVENPESEQYKKLNEEYKKVYGADKFISTPQQAAAADAIIRASVPQEEGQEQEIDYQRRQDDKRINIVLNQGGGSGASPIRDVFNEINNAVSLKQRGNLPINELSTTAQSIVLKQARDLMGNNDLSQAEVYISKLPDGKIVIKKTKKPRVIGNDDATIGEMDFTGTNINIQPSVKEKRAVVEQGKNVKPQPKKVDKTKDPLGLGL